MTYDTLPSINLTQGFEGILYYVNTITLGSFVPFLFLMIWLSLTFLVYFFQQTQTNKGDFAMSSALGSFGTLVSLVFLTLQTEGLVTLSVGSVVVVCCLGFIAWFIMSKE